MADVVQALAARGLRVTPQRVAIYETLLPRRDHPTVETLYQEVHSRFRSMSLNTLYTTLLSLEKAGLVRRIDSGDGKCRYDGNPLMHTHVVCRTCLRVDDILLGVEPDQHRLIHEAAMTSGYTVEDSALYFYGVCPDCKSNPGLKG